mmetsp:Transcript_66775/g.149036  ORF Transcript_66775/g.149036 Transcript_66775/m.149036 type:complete len:212 (+) Transcript_66775:1792-2427(+)
MCMAGNHHSHFNLTEMAFKNQPAEETHGVAALVVTCVIKLDIYIRAKRLSLCMVHQDTAQHVEIEVCITSQMLPCTKEILFVRSPVHDHTHQVFRICIFHVLVDALWRAGKVRDIILSGVHLVYNECQLVACRVSRLFPLLVVVELVRLLVKDVVHAFRFRNSQRIIVMCFKCFLHLRLNYAAIRAPSEISLQCRDGYVFEFGRVVKHVGE